MNALIAYLKDVRAEMEHISWPSRDVVINHTILVIVIAVVVGIGLGLLDNGFNHVLSRLLSLA